MFPRLAIVALLAGALTSFAAPTPALPRATCPTAFPSSFKIKVSPGSEYLAVNSTGYLVEVGSKAQASTFYINSTSFEGVPGVPQLGYSTKAGNESSFINTNNTPYTYIQFLRSSPAVGAPYDAVQVSLQSGCTIFFQPFEAHADFYLQSCKGAVLLSSTQTLPGCTDLTATLVT